MDRELLFTRFSLSDIFRTLLEQLDERIHKEARDYILSVNEDEYRQHLESEFTISPLYLDREHTVISKQFEDEVEVMDFEERIRVKHSFLTFAIPFTGERELFFYKPSTYNNYRPRAKIPSGSEMYITLQDEGDADSLKKELEYILDQIDQYLVWQRDEIEKWNQDLPALVQSKFEARKAKLLKDSGMVESLGFPLRKREGTPTSYSLPVKKKIGISRPSAKMIPYKPHPQIDEQTYGDILKVLRNMTLIMERSPSAFKDLDEEAIRMHFLMQLNGAFEAEATGETFNFGGKTDILLRYSERNVFVAECKFWDGSKNFTKTIDQLLNYLTWRDSKTAIIIFVRDTAISTVLGKIPSLLKNHAQFVSEVKARAEYEFRVHMKSLRDEALPLTLTVQVYHVPSNKGS